MVLLEVGQRGRLDLALTVGGVGETVTVTGVTPLLDTQTAVVGNVVSQDEVAKLPLAIRNWDDLLSPCPACRATATARRAARPTPGAPAASTSTATGRCRTTSCSTASTTTRSRPTCRS